MASLVVRKNIFMLLVCLQACTGGKEMPALGVLPEAETAPVASTGDAADDPAIWVNAADPNASLILGTDKQYGLLVYNLAGEQLQSLPRGRLNNIDLRQSVQIDGHRITLAAATNRTHQTLDLFIVSKQGQVSFVKSSPLSLEQLYGICLYHNSEGNLYAFVNDKTGEYQQWWLNPDRRLTPRPVRAFSVDSQPEGCVADDASGKLYLGEEDVGIWVMEAAADAGLERRLVDSVNARYLVADVEGMSIYRPPVGTAWLVVSSQGNNSYVVYALPSARADQSAMPTFAGAFTVADNPKLGIDGVQETDGLDVTAAALGEAFADGLLVVQDGHNTNPGANQNFKLVPWTGIRQALGLAKDTD